MSLSRIDSNSIATGAINAGDLADGSITTAKIEANAITSVQIAANAITSTNIEANAVTSTQIASGTVEQYLNDNSVQLFFRNRIINGDMRIDQRNAGANVTLTGGTNHAVDRWAAVEDTDGGMTAQQDSSAPVGFVNSIKFTTTTADGSLSALQYAATRQRIEGTNVSDLAWGTANAKTVTLSFWVRSSLTGTFGGALSNSAFNRSYPFTYTISVADTFEYKTVEIEGDTTGTWLTTTGIGIQVVLGLGVGSTYSGTAGSWADAGYFSATGAVSVIGTLNATWFVTGVQLEVGSVATPFERRPFGTELYLCQRYYYRDTSPSANNTMHSAMNAVCNGTTTAFCYGTYPVIMRAAPTALEQTGTASNYNLFVNNASVTLSAVPTFSVASTRGASVLATAASGFVLNAAGILRGASGAFLGWSAEL